MYIRMYVCMWGVLRYTCTLILSSRSHLTVYVHVLFKSHTSMLIAALFNDSLANFSAVPFKIQLQPPLFLSSPDNQCCSWILTSYTLPSLSTPPPYIAPTSIQLSHTYLISYQRRMKHVQHSLRHSGLLTARTTYYNGPENIWTTLNPEMAFISQNPKGQRVLRETVWNSRCERDNLFKFLLHFKPIHTWCALLSGAAGAKSGSFLHVCHWR